MKLNSIPFGITDWDQIERTEHQDDTDIA